MALIDLNTPANWPGQLQVFLDQHASLFAGWERRSGSVTSNDYDSAIRALDAVLTDNSIRGWHCTRLTDTEVGTVLGEGMVLPDGEFLGRRIAALSNVGVFDSSLAARLKAHNQANDANRRGRIWFCFYPPRCAGECGIERFFRHWGGESLYNTYEDDPVVAPVLSRIGRPSLVEADVPIASLGNVSDLSMNLVKRFLRTRAVQVGRAVGVSEHVDFDGYAVIALARSHVRRIVQFPDSEFDLLTGCATWHRLLAMHE